MDREGAEEGEIEGKTKSKWSRMRKKKDACGEEVEKEEHILIHYVRNKKRTIYKRKICLRVSLTACLTSLILQ